MDTGLRVVGLVFSFSLISFGLQKKLAGFFPFHSFLGYGVITYCNSTHNN